MGQNQLMADIQFRVPSASSLVGSAFRVVEWEIRLVREWLLLPARVLVLLDDAEGIVQRVRGLLDEVDRTVRAIDGIVATAAETVDGVRNTVARANRVVDGVDDTVSAADGIVGRVGATVDSADGVVARVGATVDTADDLVLDAGGLIERVVPLVDFAESSVAPIKPVVEALLRDADLDPDTARLVATRLIEVLAWADKMIRLLQPIADEVLGSVDPEEVKAVVQFIDHLPELGQTLESDVMPVLASLDTVAPEVHQILDVAQQCLEAVAGIPGFQLLRRRGGENGKPDS